MLISTKFVSSQNNSLNSSIQADYHFKGDIIGVGDAICSQISAENYREFVDIDHIVDIDRAYELLGPEIVRCGMQVMEVCLSNCSSDGLISILKTDIQTF